MRVARVAVLAKFLANGFIRAPFSETMVDYNPKAWFSLILHSYSRHVMRTLRPVLVAMGVFSFVICYVVLDVFRLHEKDLHSTIAMHQLLGIVLGLFLVFRTNSAYDRWWEGRKLWGNMVNSTRNLALKLNAYLPTQDEENRSWFAMMVPNFVVMTKEHLRGAVQLGELDIADMDILQQIRHARHKPNHVAALLYKRVNALYRAAQLTDAQHMNLDKELKDLVDIVGACERIKNTPIPYSYSMYIKKFIFIYIITLPFGFVTTTEYMTVPIVILISFVILSVELIAEEIEDPFGRDINDLPTDELSAKIKDNVREILM
jgi:putative membrane protein